MTWVGGDLHGEKCSDSGLPDSAGCPSLLPLLLQGKISGIQFNFIHDFINLNSF